MVLTAFLGAIQRFLESFWEFYTEIKKSFLSSGKPDSSWWAETGQCLGVAQWWMRFRRITSRASKTGEQFKLLQFCCCWVSFPQNMSKRHISILAIKEWEIVEKNRHINTKKSHVILVGGMPGTSALQVTVEACKDKKETLAKRGAGVDLPFPEAAPVKTHSWIGKQK